MCRSPVYATFTEELEGGASIRAYNAQPRFCLLNQHQVALAQQAAFAGLLSGQKHAFAHGRHQFCQCACSSLLLLIFSSPECVQHAPLTVSRASAMHGFESLSMRQQICTSVGLMPILCTMLWNLRLLHVQQRWFQQTDWLATQK